MLPCGSTGLAFGLAGVGEDTDRGLLIGRRVKHEQRPDDDGFHSSPLCVDAYFGIAGIPQEAQHG